jgi:twitching motility protein PilT
MAYFDPEQLFETMLDAAPGVSDLNLSVGAIPQIEVDGKLLGVDFGGLKRLLPYHTELVAMRLLNDKMDLAEKLIETGSVDLSYSLRQRGRFRVNIFSQRGTYSIVLRVISNEIPSFDELGLPPQIAKIADEINGIVLITGPTGSGKSTSLAAVIDKMNRERAIHIITIEDPIEYLHHHQKAIINQREVGGDTQSFALALRAALRQAPKVILVGEMRDVETISTALEAAETGHLVLSTLHTIDASKTIDRIVGVFPKNEERQIRTRFAQSFKWIISQRLVPKRDGGRAAVCEILRATSRTKEYVQEGEREGRSLVDAMEDGGLDGMQTFDSELVRFIEDGTIDSTVALSYASNPTNLRIRLGFDGTGEGVESESAAAGAKSTSEAMVDTDMENLIER